MFVLVGWLMFVNVEIKKYKIDYNHNCRMDRITTLLVLTNYFEIFCSPAHQIFAEFKDNIPGNEINN